MIHDLTYQEALDKANSLKDIGATKIYLFDKHGYKPWDRVTKVKHGGGIRLGLPTSIDLTAYKDGLEFQWAVEMETREANGKGTFEFNTVTISQVMDSIPKAARIQLASVLRAAAEAVEEKGDEYREYANRQYGYGESLRRIANQGG